MIITTIESLLSIKLILQKLANTNMSAKNAFKVLKTLKLIEREYESIEIVQRRMLDKYGSKDEQGRLDTDAKGNYIIKAELIDEYMQEMQNFLSQEIELNCSKIDFSILEQLEFTPTQLIMIENFIEDYE